MNDLISREDALNFEMNLEAESEQEMLGIVRGMQIYADHIKSLPGVGWIKVTSRQTYDELDELIANLRNCAKVNSLSMYKRGLMKQAADAVEKLQQNIEQYKLYLQDAINDLRSAHEKEHKWIPVTERLPLYGQDVLAVRTYGDGEKCQEVLMAHIAVWNEETGEKWWNATNITHWMPLPSTEGLNEA